MRLRRIHTPVSHPDPMQQVDAIADAIVALAEQLKATVAELRRQDTRGDDDE